MVLRKINNIIFGLPVLLPRPDTSLLSRSHLELAHFDPISDQTVNAVSVDFGMKLNLLLILLKR